MKMGESEGQHTSLIPNAANTMSCFNDKTNPKRDINDNKDKVQSE